MSIVPEQASALLELSAFYNSSNQAETGSRRSGKLGAGWSHTYERALQIAGGAVRAFRPDGKQLIFQAVSGSYAADVDVTDKLVPLSSGQGWLYYDMANGLIEVYNASGVLLSLHELGGGSASLTYSTTQTDISVAPDAGLPISVSDQFGRQIQLRYQPIGYLSKAIDAMGRDYTFGIDDNDNFASLSYPATVGVESKSFLYGEAEYTSSLSLPNNLTGLVDEAGRRYATWTYDESGQASGSSHFGGKNSYELAYAIGISDVSVTTPHSGGWQYEFTAIQGVKRLSKLSRPHNGGAAWSSFDYDVRGNITSLVNYNGNKSCSAYEVARNLETVRVEGLANNVVCAGIVGSGASLPAGSRKITTEWHPDWAIKTREAGPNKRITWVYNGRPDPFNSNALASCAPSGVLLPDGRPIVVLCKRVEESTTNASGSLGFGAAVGIGLSGNTTPATRTWTFTYNQYGQVLTEDGPRTDVTDITLYAYYTNTSFAGSGAQAIGHTQGDLQSVTDALGKQTQYTKYNKAGQVLESVDANSVTTTLGYDVRGRLHTRTVAGLQGSPRTTTYDYDSRGLLEKVTFPPGTVVNAAGTGGSSQGRQVTYRYDEAHRLIGITSASGDEVVYTLNNAGQIESTEWRHANAVDPAKNPTTLTRREFDGLGRLWKQIHRVNGVEHTTETTYDAEGNLAAIERPAVDGETSNPKEIRQYNALNQLKQIEDARHAVTTIVPKVNGDTQIVLAPGGIGTGWTLDGFGEVLQEVSNDRGVTTQTFDASGNLKTRTDARGITATYTYDALNRVTVLAFSGTGVTGTSYNETYTWDVAPSGAPFTCANGTWRLCRVVQGDRITWFSYDAFGNVSQQRDSVGSIATDHQWAWDGENRLIGSTTTPTGSSRAMVIERDLDGRPKAVNATVNTAGGSASQQIVKEASYRADGIPERTKMGNDKVFQREFDDGGNLKGQQE